MEKTQQKPKPGAPYHRHNNNQNHYYQKRSNYQKPRNQTPPVNSEESKQKLIELLHYYLESYPHISHNNNTPEVEVRFGTKSNKPITKLDYDRIVQKLYSNGFTTDIEEGTSYLRIQNEYRDPNTGNLSISKYRTEIEGGTLIEEYCRTNSIEKLLSMASAKTGMVKFTKKSPVNLPSSSSHAEGRSAYNDDHDDDDDKKPTQGKEIIKDVWFPDYNYSVSYKTESDFNASYKLAGKIINNWTNTKKQFRYINRVRFRHDTYPIFVDISIVKSSKKQGKKYIPELTIEEAGVFSNPEEYEIELEIDNRRMSDMTIDRLLVYLRKCIRIVLSGIQGSNFPIPFHEQNTIIQAYMKLIHGDEYEPRMVTTDDFIGPSSFTLQIPNIMDNTSTDSQVPNIRRNYTVTDKADGDRKMMYVHENGKIYLIDTNMNVLYTGAVTQNQEFFHSLLDGEHIIHGKNGKYINLYAAFDIYYLNKRNTRVLSLVPTKSEEEMEEEENAEGEEKKDALEEGEVEEEKPMKKHKEPEVIDFKNYRLFLLNEFMKSLKPYTPSSGSTETTTHTEDKTCVMMFQSKTFYMNSSKHDIFYYCNQILTSNTLPYNTDGLIFTPANMAVGGVKPVSYKSQEKSVLEEVNLANRKEVWKYSFKWKPPEYNTIDFLVRVKTTDSGKDEIHNIFQDGIQASKGTAQVTQYKTLILHCGFSKRSHGYINPWHSLIEGDVPKVDDIDNTENYRAVPFQPTDPTNKNACFCNIMLQGKDAVMLTKENEVIESNTIVEFYYDKTAKEGWKWKPLRVRYDKTAKFRNGLREFGNAYHVANSNWFSIHHEITRSMITTGNDIPTEWNDDVYYNNKDTDEKYTAGMRDFHNLFVKQRLIKWVANPGDTLIDYACGKGGDIPKWIAAKLSFVFGIDIFKSNIENQLNGACARYLNYAKKTKKIFKAMFVSGDSSRNIRSTGDAFLTTKDKEITKAVFGKGEKNADKLGKGVYEIYGKGEHGFHISSCQFAMHYMFQTEKSVHGFVRNLSECTRVGGYFIGTCYDGDRVFQLMKQYAKGESFIIKKNDVKIYEIQKMYDYTSFKDDSTSLGYAINVYQDSINKMFTEYLVNFPYFQDVMRRYGFELDTTIGKGSATFESLFSMMQKESGNARSAVDYQTALSMTPEEKTISFLNRYFIFKKVYNVDANRIFTMTDRERKEEEELNKGLEDEILNSPLQPPASPAADAPASSKRKTGEDDEQPSYKIRKVTKRKMIINKYSPIEKEVQAVEPDIEKIAEQPAQETTIAVPPPAAAKRPKKRVIVVSPTTTISKK